MSKSVVITVGTSLLSAGKEIVADGLRALANAALSGSLEQLQSEIEDMISSGDENIRRAESIMAQRWAIVQSGSADIEDFRNLSAELASLARFSAAYPLDREQDQLHLICSDSHTGWLSGRLLQLFLKDQVVDRTYLHPVEGLKARDERSFKNTGLRNLVDEIAELSRRGDLEVFIIATGGYKAGSVYTSLMGMLCNRPIYYLHEDFQENIDLPVLPIHLDFDLWRENAERIELILNLPAEHAEPFYHILDERIRNLIHLNDSSNSYIWTPAGEILYRAYKDASIWSQFQAGGRSLLFHLKRDALKDRYGRYLQEISEHIWIGDKVPEMVDHALKHHHNLFELAEMFLVPVLRSNPDFMSPEEVYVLLCVILLHDCGHSLNMFPGVPDRPLLPTEIRNWHHILGYQRLNPDFYRPGEDQLLPELASIQAGRPADQKAMRDFWEDELKLIATVGLYHRRDMPLEHGEYRDDLLPTEIKIFKPLSSKRFFFQGREFTRSAIKIAAIFRIIDSCDVQLSRTGTEKERKLRLGLLAADISAEVKRERDASELLSLVLEQARVTGIKEAVESEIKTSRLLYRKKERRELKGEEEKEQLKARIRGFQKAVQQVIGEIGEPDKRRIAQLAVDLRREVSNRVDFKREQEAHFSRAARVERVSVAHSSAKGMNRFIITIHGLEEDRDCLEELRRSMLEEYETAEPVLSEYDVMLDYRLDLRGEAKRRKVNESERGRE